MASSFRLAFRSRGARPGDGGLQQKGTHGTGKRNLGPLGAFRRGALRLGAPPAGGPRRRACAAGSPWVGSATPAAGKPMSDAKFAEFVKAKKLDPRRIRAASRALETLRPEDRAIRLAKRADKAGGADGENKADKETRKPD